MQRKLLETWWHTKLKVRVIATCFLTYSATVFVLLTALYVILRPVNQGLALIGAVFRLVFAWLWLLTALNLLAALRLLGSASYLQAFEADRLQVLARLSVAANSTTTTLACRSLD